MKDITLFLNEQLNATKPNTNEGTEGKENTEGNDQVNEAKVESEEDFREYAEKVLKEAHGDNYDADKAKETIDGILEDNKELVEEGKWAEIVGIFNKGVTKED